MAIVRVGGGGQVAKAAGKKAALKHAGKKAALKKHAGKKAAGKKAAPERHAAKKHAAKKSAAGMQLVEAHEQELSHAFHHMQRAAAVISLLEHDSGGDLRSLLEHGMELYRNAADAKRRDGSAGCGTGLLRAAEHLSMAGLYAARSDFRVNVPPPPRRQVEKALRELGPRLDRLKMPERAAAQRLCRMARELLTRAEQSEHDPHLEYELTMASEGICAALEQGL